MDFVVGLKAALPYIRLFSAIIFSVGITLTVLRWSRPSSKHEEYEFPTGRKTLVALKVIFLNWILGKPIYEQGFTRWLMHITIFIGALGLFVVHVFPRVVLAVSWETLFPYVGLDVWGLTYNVLFFMLIFGAVIALTRRFTLEEMQVRVDAYNLIPPTLILAVSVTGFFLTNIGLVGFQFSDALFLTHYIATYVAVAIFPFSKFLHIIATPTVMMANQLRANASTIEVTKPVWDKTSSPTLLDGLSELQQVEVDACTQCGTCVKWCPTHDVLSQENLTPRGKIVQVRQVVRSLYGPLALLFGLRHVTDEGINRLKDDLYRCTTCGTCKAVCEANLSTVNLWEDLRAGFVSVGIGPADRQKPFLPRVKEKRNPYNEEPEKRLEWLPADVKVAEKAELGVFVGCTQSYREKLQAASTARLLQRLGVPFTLLGVEEYCCGSPLIRTGQLEVVEDLVKHNVSELMKRGVKRVLYSCAGCYRTSKLDWSRYYGRRLPFEVVHITQFLLEKIREGKIKFKRPLNRKVTYHDPCHIGRHSGIYEEPREVLRSIPGLKIVEMERTQELARCCGAGGGVKGGFPDLALSMAENRIKDAELTGADILTTSCPFCMLNLRDAIKAAKSKLELIDLTELVIQQMA